MKKIQLICVFEKQSKANLKKQIQEKQLKKQHSRKQNQENNFEKRRTIMQKKTIQNFIEEEDGLATVEIILIIVVLIGLVMIFKNQLTNIVNDIFTTISSQSSSI